MNSLSDKTILIHTDLLAIYEEDGRYYDANGRNLRWTLAHCKVGLLAFDKDSDTGNIDNVQKALDILLQCLEHRLARRNLANPLYERTNALEHLRKLREWLELLEQRIWDNLQEE